MQCIVCMILVPFWSPPLLHWLGMAESRTLSYRFLGPGPASDRLLDRFIRDEER